MVDAGRGLGDGAERVDLGDHLANRRVAARDQDPVSEQGLSLMDRSALLAYAPGASVPRGVS
jgi:hypothetical protein